MSLDERRLLLAVARCVAERLEAEAAKMGTTDNWAAEMRHLIELIRPKGPGE